MFAADALTLLLAAGVVVLVVSTAFMATGFTASRSARARRNRRTRRAAHPLTPSAKQTLEVARARAAVHQADQQRHTGAAATSPAGGNRQLPTGQIIDISDGRRQGRTMSVEYAQAIAEHVAENDPQRVAEVINQWIRADSTDPLDLFR